MSTKGSRAEDAWELCGHPFSPQQSLSSPSAGRFSKVISGAAGTQTQVSKGPHVPCYLLTALSTAAFRRPAESQSKTFLEQDKAVRGDKGTLDAWAQGSRQQDSC